MSKRIFLSDVHSNASWGSIPEPGKYLWDWFGQDDCNRFVSFTQDIIKNDTGNGCNLCVDPEDCYREIVLLGDIFDNWNFPYDIKPPTMDELLEQGSAKKVVDTINNLIKSTQNGLESSTPIKVIYSVGNHDMTMTQKLVSKHMPEVVFAGSTRFNSGRLQAEHGNEYCLFCSQDPIRINGLPLGYFISRMATTCDRDTGSHQISTELLIAELVKVLEHKDNIVLAVFDAICSKANVSFSDKILMPDDLWGGVSISVSEVREMYRNLYQEYEKRCGEIMAILSIPSEMGSLGLVASALFLRGGINAIIMGHTHKAVVHRKTLPIIGELIYLNSGCWCNKIPKATWVEAEKDSCGKNKYEIFGCGYPNENSEFAGEVRMTNSLVSSEKW